MAENTKPPTKTNEINGSLFAHFGKIVEIGISFLIHVMNHFLIKKSIVDSKPIDKLSFSENHVI